MLIFFLPKYEFMHQNVTYRYSSMLPLLQVVPAANVSLTVHDQHSDTQLYQGEQGVLRNVLKRILDGITKVESKL